MLVNIFCIVVQQLLIIEIKIPFINKAIALDKDDINEFKEMLSKI